MLTNRDAEGLVHYKSIKSYVDDIVYVWAKRPNFKQMRGQDWSLATRIQLENIKDDLERSKIVRNVEKDFEGRGVN